MAKKDAGKAGEVDAAAVVEEAPAVGRKSLEGLTLTEMYRLGMSQADINAHLLARIEALERGR